MDNTKPQTLFLHGQSIACDEIDLENNCYLQTPKIASSVFGLLQDIWEKTILRDLSAAPLFEAGSDLTKFNKLNEMEVNFLMTLHNSGCCGQRFIRRSFFGVLPSISLHPLLMTRPIPFSLIERSVSPVVYA
jgi:hypothetical protein